MIVKKGSTDVSIYVNLVDSAAGTPETGLTITSIDATYTRNRAAAVKNDLTALGAANSSHADNQGIEVDSTNAPGLYRVDFPDAAFASGADKVILTVTCSGCAPAHLIVQLVNYDPEDTVRMGLTALPNAAADAAGGLPISDAGGLDLDAQIGTKINDILTDTGTTLDGKINTIDGIVDDILVDTAEIGTAGAGLTNINLPNQTMDIVGNITGNLSGSVGSIATGGIQAVSFAAGAIDAAAIAANAIGASELASDAVAEIADQVWDEIVSGHSVSGSTGEALSAAGGAGDPWITALPGSYSSGQAGYILGNNLNATVGSRATQTSVDDLPTNAELATSQASADDATLAAIAALSIPTAAQIRSEIDSNSTQLAAIVADTSELQSDWANGGRLDLILDARASQASVDDVPTNAELSTALGTADDATLAAIAALSIPTTSQIATAVLTTQMTESYRGTGAAPTLAQAQFELIAHMGESSIASTTKTLKKLDGSTTAKTYTLNDATTPTAITETT